MSSKQDHPEKRDRSKQLLRQMTAKAGQVIHIGDAITLRISEVQGEEVLFEIDVPPELIVEHVDKVE